LASTKNESPCVIWFLSIDLALNS